MNDLSRIRKANRKISRAAVARSLRELKILFSGMKEKFGAKDKSHGKVAFIGAAEITLQPNDSTTTPQQQAEFGGKHG